MEIKKTDFLLTLSIIGLLLLGTVGPAVAVQLVSSNSNSGLTNSIDCTPANPNAKIKNVIVLIPDGCSQSVETLARWYSGQPLEVDDMATGTVSTYATDSVVTDSSVALIAFATGYILHTVS